MLVPCDGGDFRCASSRETATDDAGLCKPIAKAGVRGRPDSEWNIGPGNDEAWLPDFGEVKDLPAVIGNCCKPPPPANAGHGPTRATTGAPAQSMRDATYHPVRTQDRTCRRSAWRRSKRSLT